MDRFLRAAEVLPPGVNPKHRIIRDSNVVTEFLLGWGEHHNASVWLEHPHEVVRYLIVMPYAAVAGKALAVRTLESLAVKYSGLTDARLTQKTLIAAAAYFHAEGPPNAQMAKVQLRGYWRGKTASKQVYLDAATGKLMRMTGSAVLP